MKTQDRIRGLNIFCADDVKDKKWVAHFIPVNHPAKGGNETEGIHFLSF
jgi:hypothetical protein